MFRRSHSRGTSVLAALVFVALLTGVALAVSELSPTAPRAQLAQAATPVPKPSQVEQDCTAAKQAAATNRTQTKSQTGTQKDNEVEDSCVAAIPDPAKASLSPSNPDKYKCVGRNAIVSVSPESGYVTVKSTPNADKPASVCATIACQPDFTNPAKQKCINADLVGLNGSKIGDYMSGTSPDVQPFSIDKAKLGDLYDSTGMPLDPRAIGNLDSAFAEQQQSNAKQSSEITSQLADVEREIGKYTAECSIGNCDVQKLEELQAREADLKAKQAALQQQTEALSAVQKKLSPEQGVDPAAAQPGVDQYCKQTGTCVGGDGKQIPRTGFEKKEAQEPPAGEGKSAGGLGAGLEKMLAGILGGLAKGLGGALAGNTAPACSSDPNLYAQQQQQYNQQLQQYNLQLQQYNYQAQYAQVNGFAPPQPPVAPQACQRTSNSNTCPTAPAQPTTSCSGTWQPVKTQLSNGAQCTTSWQCVPPSAVQPTAQISCQPLVADVGMSVAIAYTCGNATGSEALGFDSGNATSGSTSTVLTTPPSGVNTATFGIACKNSGVVAKAECSVQVGRPSIVLVATPKIVKSGESSNIGWITSGMKSCVISSPTLVDFTAQNATNTSVSGAVTTPSLTADTTFQLMCTTVGSSARAASTTVLIATSTTP